MGLGMGVVPPAPLVARQNSQPVGFVAAIPLASPLVRSSEQLRIAGRIGFDFSSVLFPFRLHRSPAGRVTLVALVAGLLIPAVGLPPEGALYISAVVLGLRSALALPRHRS